jgi:hypothetical protein
MDISKERERIVAEINLIPQDRLPEVYALLHGYRLNLKQDTFETDAIMTFAGCWHDMPDEEYQEMMAEIGVRRQRAFQGRRAGAISIN